MAKITITDLEPNHLITVSLTEIAIEVSDDDDDPEEFIPEEEAPMTNLVGLPKKTA